MEIGSGVGLDYTRNWIFQVHISTNYVQTQITQTVYSVDYRNLVILATMGLAVICNTLREATARHNGEPTKEARRAIAFIQSTGLEITIQRFGLDIDAQRIREGFFKIAHE